jgi:hypothetical protein
MIGCVKNNLIFIAHVQGVLANRDDFWCDLKLKATQIVASWTKKSFTMLKQPSHDSFVRASIIRDDRVRQEPVLCTPLI